MKFLVVGANSVLAKAIILRLHKKHEVIGVFNKNKENLVEEIENISVSELNNLQDEFEAVFIISAHIPEKGKPVNRQLLNEVNVLLPEFISKKFRSARIVYASSVSVYGDRVDIVNENSLTETTSEYGMSKMRGEEVIRKHEKYAILRISSMYCSGMNSSTFLPSIIESAVKNKRIRIYGNGTRAQNYIYVGDVADFFICAAEKSTNNTYLAVGVRSYTNMELASNVKEQLSDVEIELFGEDASPSFFYDASKTYDLLKIAPQKLIEEGILELITWQQKKY